MRHTPGSDQLIVRDARPEELDDVATLLTECYAGYADVFPPGLWEAYHPEITAVRSRLGVSELIVASRSRELLGTVTFYPDAGLDEHGWPPGAASFRLLAVRPAERGLGVGRRLVEECVRRARRYGAAFLGLHTAPFMVSATRLYERMGFARAPRFDFDPHRHYTAGASPPSERVPGLAYLRAL